MTHMPNAEELEALKKALAEALGELRVVRTERDLLKEQLNRFKRQLFDAKSEKMGEASAAHQKDMFFNEAEAQGAQAQPAAEETDDDKIDVPAHRRAKRGRKPLDPALPREVIRHELPEAERVCPHDGAALREIGVEVSEQLDIVPQQVRVIRHERVKYACPCCDGGSAPGCEAAASHPQGIAQRGGAGLGDHVEVPRWAAAVPAGRAAGPLRRHAAVAQHAGRRRRARGPGGAAGGQPAARRAAGLAHRARRRDRGAGAQGAGQEGPGQELHVGADDRSQRRQKAPARRSGCSATRPAAARKRPGRCTKACGPAAC